MRVCEYHLHSHRAPELRGTTLLRLLKATEAMRRPEQFEAFVVACEADARGRKGFEQKPYPQADYLRAAAQCAASVNAAQFTGAKIKGKALGEAIDGERVRLLNQLRKMGVSA